MSQSPAISACAEALEELCNVVTPPAVVVSDSELNLDIAIGNEDGEDVISDQNRTCESQS